MDTFHSRGWWYNIAFVLCDRETTDFAHLIGQRVVIDDRPYQCVGVQAMLHTPPWREGESVGLKVKPLQRKKFR